MVNDEFRRNQRDRLALASLPVFCVARSFTIILSTQNEPPAGRDPQAGRVVDLLMAGFHPLYSEYMRMTEDQIIERVTP